MAAKRDDLGAPVDSYYAEQPAGESARCSRSFAHSSRRPAGRDASIKWGALLSAERKNVCSIAAFKEHVESTSSHRRTACRSGEEARRRREDHADAEGAQASDIDSASILRWLHRHGGSRFLS